MSNVEIIDFYRPDDDCKNIFVSNIPSVIDEDSVNVIIVNNFYQTLKLRLPAVLSDTVII